jgi:hypothetical protein
MLPVISATGPNVPVVTCSPSPRPQHLRHTRAQAMDHHPRQQPSTRRHPRTITVSRSRPRDRAPQCGIDVGVGCTTSAQAAHCMIAPHGSQAECSPWSRCELPDGRVAHCITPVVGCDVEGLVGTVVSVPWRVWVVRARWSVRSGLRIGSRSVLLRGLAGEGVVLRRMSCCRSRWMGVLVVVGLLASCDSDDAATAPNSECRRVRRIEHVDGDWPRWGPGGVGSGAVRPGLRITRGVRLCSGLVRRNMIDVSNRSEGGERCPSSSGSVRSEPSWSASWQYR